MDEIDYNVDDSQRRNFCSRLHILPLLTREDLSPIWRDQVEITGENGPFRI